MLSTIKKDKNRRHLVRKFEIKRLQAKVFREDLSLKTSFETKLRQTRSESKSNVSLSSLFYQKLAKAIPRNSSLNRVQNRCIETGRSHAVLRFCKLSRIVLRDKASKGLIPGVSKASW